MALFRCLLLLPEIELVNLVCLILALLELLLEYLAVEAISKLILVSLLLQLQLEFLCFTSQLNDLSANFRVLLLFILDKVHESIDLLFDCCFNRSILPLLQSDFLFQLFHLMLFALQWHVVYIFSLSLTVGEPVRYRASSVDLSRQLFFGNGRGFCGGVRLCA